MAGSSPSSSSSSSADNKIRVLIVDDIPETRENLRKLLFFDTDIEVVGAATNGQEGIEMAGELQPDVVLMDINMPGVDGIKASEIITQQSPYTQVIIMSVQGEADYLRRSMLAGAREFLIKPFTGGELITSIRRVYELGQQQRERISYTPNQGSSSTAAAKSASDDLGKIIAIYSPKGGAGCSTLAINLAIATHKAQSVKVGLVDASLQFGDIAVLLNVQARRTIADLAPHSHDLELDLIDTVMAAHNSGIKALLAPPQPEMADLITPEVIVNVLTRMRQMFDVIFVDMYSSLEDIVIHILDESDLVVLVTTPEIPAIKSARLFYEVTEALEYPPHKTHLVLNKADRRIGIRAADIEASIKNKVIAQFPLEEKTVTTAINQGVPYVLGSNGTPLSQATIAYAKHLYQAVIKTPPRRPS
jgi:pilus assembly protein CpaE